MSVRLRAAFRASRTDVCATAGLAGTVYGPAYASITKYANLETIFKQMLIG